MLLTASGTLFFPKNWKVPKQSGVEKYLINYNSIFDSDCRDSVPIACRFIFNERVKVIFEREIINFCLFFFCFTISLSIAWTFEIYFGAFLSVFDVIFYIYLKSAIVFKKYDFFFAKIELKVMVGKKQDLII